MADFPRTHETTCEQVAEALKDNIKGKTILITGVSPNSLGAQCALTLAAHSPALLILAGRNAGKVDATASAVERSSPGTAVRTLALDLASLASVRAAAAELRAAGTPIDVLINNAAIMAAPYMTTADGFEAQFGTNHLGHFVFTNEIMPLVLASRDRRIVNVSSAGHVYSPVRFDDPGWSAGAKYEKWGAYGQAKTANILFSIALAQRLGAQGVRAFSLHPGGIQTNLGVYIKDEMEAMVENIKKKMPDFKWKNLSQGTATHIVAAFDPSILDQNGAFLLDCHIAEGDDWHPWARDPADAEKLWKLSEKMVGQEYNY